ncbi:MAG: FAD-dependent oxidoreductase [Phycisphaerales bacterium]|nr:FAD-dependent oxidoreductase [Phycisphaerales bacterium]
MPLLIRDLRLELDDPPERLIDVAAKRLKLPASAIGTYAPVRRSLDARRHDDLHFVYHVELALRDGSRQEHAVVKRLNGRRVAVIRPRDDHDPIPGREPAGREPVIVGFGPAGMFAALRLIDFGYRPIVLERGQPVRTRHRDVLHTFYRHREFNPESNLLYGEGGAGTYSDGKLYTRLNDPLVETVRAWLYRHGAHPDVMIDARPHIGSDRLPTICWRIREFIERHGGAIRFAACVDDVLRVDDRVQSITVNGQPMTVGPLMLAIGHSARDTIRLLHDRGFRIEPRPFQLGVRVEHPQTVVDGWQYGACAADRRLPSAEYHVVARHALGERDCYSFCMCPGGEILPTMEQPGLIATNGASRAGRHGPFANSGLVVTVQPDGADRDPLAGLSYQAMWERAAYDATRGSYRVPCQRASDYLTGQSSDGMLATSYPLGGQWSDIRTILPPHVALAVQNALTVLNEKMPGFAGDDAIVTAPESRVSSPIRIVRDPERRTAIGLDNVYPIGEGAGYAGGIISAAIDGIRSADALISRYAPDVR